ncbi:uroporphyrinogen-III synthase [Sphingobium aromaticiconvertens]|uniref:uroporphyrinogen-III synthase n=1 Tax=Sphingobium aromaticiconvertens TaxID=365341 RepID=UPI003019AF70
MSRLIVLRPEPGASNTMAKAAMLGIATTACPLFRIAPIAWAPPPATDFDALLVTSAQAVRTGGADLARYHGLPSYAVGKATAQALDAAGFRNVTVGNTDGAAIAARIVADGHRVVLHLAGEDVAPFDPGPLRIRREALYAAVEAADRAALAAVLEPDTVLMVHSPRAGGRLNALVDEAARHALHIVAISPAALATCGEGWASARAADAPNDTAMLALAALLCEGHSHAKHADGGS